jgi:hypothetical protein
MTQDQIYAIKCALADLAGALEQHHFRDRLGHDWESHACTIQDLYDNFKEDCNLEHPAILEEVFFEDPSDYVGMGWVGQDGRP